MNAANPEAERTSPLRRSDAQGADRVRSILEGAHEAFIAMDGNGLITDWNRQAEITFGWSREEAIGRVLADTVLPERLRERHWRQLRRFLATGHGRFLGQRLEVQALHRDGHEFPVEVTMSAIKTGSGYALYGFLHDISDRTRAEEQLTVARELAFGIANAETLEEALALALGKIGVWGGWDLGEAWVRGANAPALEHRKAWFASSSKFEPFERKTKGVLLERGVGLPGRAWSAGRSVWVRDVKSDPYFLRSELAAEVGLAAAMAVPVTAGRDVVAVLCFFRSDVRDEDRLLVDAVDAVAAQLGSLVQRKRAELELRASEARYRLLAENSTDMIMVTDPDGLILYVSPSCSALSGFAPEEMLGRSGFDFVHPDDAGLIVDCFRILFQGADQVTTPPHRGRRKDGSYRWWESSARAIRDPVTGSLVEVQASARDITERKQMEDELEAARTELERRAAALERSNVQLERFACDVAHDLGEPLQVMAQASQRLAREHGDQLDDEARQLLVAMVDGLDRMQSLIGDLLAYSRFSFQPLERSSVDCSVLLEDTLGLLEESTRERSARVTFDQLPTLDAHPTQLGQVFLNLLSNALKFSRAGTPPVIHVGAVREPGAWRFSVRDNGIGIDPAVTPRAFEMFGRLNPPDAYAGTGMGLSICKRVAEHHGGRIWVEPAEGGGSVFCFTIADEPPA
jgi:PAS domain S-box-containing protein